MAKGDRLFIIIIILIILILVLLTTNLDLLFPTPAPHQLARGIVENVTNATV
jgi:hypothetical protein